MIDSRLGSLNRIDLAFQYLNRRIFQDRTQADHGIVGRAQLSRYNHLVQHGLQAVVGPTGQGGWPRGKIARR